MFVPEVHNRALLDYTPLQVGYFLPAGKVPTSASAGLAHEKAPPVHQGNYSPTETFQFHEMQDRDRYDEFLSPAHTSKLGTRYVLFHNGQIDEIAPSDQRRDFWLLDSSHEYYLLASSVYCDRIHLCANGGCRERSRSLLHETCFR